MSKKTDSRNRIIEKKDNQKHEIRDWLKILFPIALSLAISLLVSYHHTEVKMAIVQEKVNKLDSELLDLKSDISDLRDVVSNLNSSLANLQGYIAGLGKANNSSPFDRTIFSYLTLTPTDDFADRIINTFSVDSSHIITDSPPSEQIATNTNTGETYSSKDLANKPFFMRYTNNTQEVYFCGQLDTDGFWDKTCITNQYQNGDLMLITEALYDKGILLSLRQAYRTKESSIWAISTLSGGSVNQSEIWTYHYVPLKSDFSYNESSANDIIDIDSFTAYLLENGSRLEGYYLGGTDRGLYNDTSGTACLVKYYDSGLVRTLYIGGILDGQLHDESGNAFMIGKLSEDQSYYAYYKGRFRYNDFADNSVSNWRYNLTPEQIAIILEGYVFNCPLKGLIESKEET